MRKRVGKSLYTDGAKYVADEAGAYWLLDEIAINQTRPEIKAEEFQVWTLKVDLEKRSGVLTCDDWQRQRRVHEENRVHRFSAGRDEDILHGRHDLAAK